jgi:hypothetical protein
VKGLLFVLWHCAWQRWCFHSQPWRRRSGARTVKPLKHGTLKLYPGFPHGMPTTHAEQINADLLTFFKTGVARPRLEPIPLLAQRVFATGGRRSGGALNDSQANVIWRRGHPRLATRFGPRHPLAGIARSCPCAG